MDDPLGVEPACGHSASHVSYSFRGGGGDGGHGHGHDHDHGHSVVPAWGMQTWLLLLRGLPA